MRRTCSVILVAALAACSVGTSAKQFEPAGKPGGAEVALDFGRRRLPLQGELLAVEDSALVVLHSDSVARVPLSVIRSGQLVPRGSRATFIRGRLSENMRERFRLLSRYPDGLSPELLQRLLAAYGQTDVLVITP